MPLIPLGTSVASASLGGLVSAILVRPRFIGTSLAGALAGTLGRNFGSPLGVAGVAAGVLGGFVADATVEEHMEDEVEMTHIPVETGAAVTDHAFKRPSRVTIRAGWSNSSPQAGGNPVFDILTYNAFLALQASLTPFTVVTGKRVYQNMLARRVSATTTEATENSLMMTVECQEIIFVTTQQVTVPPVSNMSNPPANGSINPTGQQGLQQAPLWKPPLLGAG